MNSLFSLLLKLWETFALFYMMRFICSYCWSSLKVHMWDGSSRHLVHEKWSSEEIILKGEKACEESVFFFSETHSEIEPLEVLFRVSCTGPLCCLLQVHWVLRCKQDLFLLAHRSIYLPWVGSQSMPFLPILQGGFLYNPQSDVTALLKNLPVVSTECYSLPLTDLFGWLRRPNRLASSMRLTDQLRILQ